MAARNAAPKTRAPDAGSGVTAGASFIAILSSPSRARSLSRSIFTLTVSSRRLSTVSSLVTANFVEMRRVTSELADVGQALAAAEDAWLDLEERAPA